jgi:hypothetical protein
MRGGDERRRSAVFGSDECSLPCSSAAWAEKAHLYWRGRGQLNALAATNAPGLVRRGVSSRPVVGIGGMNHILVQGIWCSERAPCPPIADGRRTECDLRPPFSCRRENTSGCPAVGRQARGAGPFQDGYWEDDRPFR